MVDLTTIETGRRFLTLLAKGGLARMEEHKLPRTDEGFKRLVILAHQSGQNAGYLLEPVQEDLKQLNNTAPLEELTLVQEAFIQGSCQRGIVKQILLGLS